MNVAVVAKAMMTKAAAHRNADLGEMLGGVFFLKNDPLLAPQKDGNYTVVRVYHGEDEKVMDLDAKAAENLLVDWLGAVVLASPNPKSEARYAAKLEELGWAE